MTTRSIIDAIDAVIGWQVLLVWLALIFALSSIPNRIVVSEPSPLPIDKVAHAGEYAVLAFVIAWLARRRWRNAAVAIMLGAALAALYGVTDELHQILVPGRDSGLPDLVADVAGAAIGAVVAGAIMRLAERSER